MFTYQLHTLQDNGVVLNVIIFHIALKQGEEQLRQYVKAVDNEGNTALHLSVQNGSEEVSSAKMVVLDHL